jgi:ribonuclease J
LLLAGPEIVSRGFVYVKEHEDLMEKIRAKAQASIENQLNNGGKDFNSLKSGVRDDMRKFIFSETKRSPMILPIFLEE